MVGYLIVSNNYSIIILNNFLGIFASCKRSVFSYKSEYCMLQHAHAWRTVVLDV